MAQRVTTEPARNQAINIRANRRQRDLIDRAARMPGKSRSQFMLAAACREAEDVLLDQAFFRLDAETFSRFSEMLDALPPPTAKLRDLLREKAPWE